MSQALRVRRLIARLAAVILVAAWPAGVTYAAEPTFANVLYDPASGQRLDVCKPVTPGPHPAVLMVHGGGWGAGSRLGYRAQCTQAAEAGIVGIPVDYRLADGPPQNRWPAQIDDLRAALAWVVSHARELDIDPKHICALGDSAGGHLVLFLAFSTPNPRIACVVDEFGPVDLTTWRGGSQDNFFGTRDPARLAALRREMSPLFLVKDATMPVLIVHGTRDTAVPISQSEALLAALQARHQTVRMITYDGEHAFKGIPNESRLWIVREAFAFIRASTTR